MNLCVVLNPVYKGEQMKIGCVKELKKYEYRVGITPDNVKEYIRHGVQVVIESGAGLGSSFRDEDYRAAGAEIMQDAKAIWQQCDMIVKVKEPLAEEYPLLRENQILYTYLHLAADKPLTEALLNRGVKAVAYETICGPDGSLPLLKPMSEIAGRLSLQEGAKCLEKPMGGRGILLGGVPGVKKANVLILGAGIVGMNACKIAVGMGAYVTIMDNSLDKLTYLDNIFSEKNVQTLYSTESAVEEMIADADLVIGSVLIPGAATPKLVRKKYLSTMREGSVIVDVAVDQGGCCETTRPTYHDNPTFVVDGVVHYCVANMPGAVANTSTLALTNATLPFGLSLATKGVETAAKENTGLYQGVNTYKGKLTCRGVSDAFSMEYTELATLL